MHFIIKPQNSNPNVNYPYHGRASSSRSRHQHPLMEQTFPGGMKYYFRNVSHGVNDCASVSLSMVMHIHPNASVLVKIKMIKLS